MPLYAVTFPGHWLTGYAVIDRPTKRIAKRDFLTDLRASQPRLARTVKPEDVDLERITPATDACILFNGDY